MTTWRQSSARAADAAYAAVASNLEERPGWTRQAGPDIGGGVPSDYDFEQHVASPSLDGSAMRLYVTGGPYCDWLTHQVIPVAHGIRRCQLDFQLYTDVMAPTVAQAIEFDTRVSIAGWNYNFSAQLEYARGGVLQYAQGGGWADTPLAPGILTPLRWHHVVLDYELNTTTRSGRFVAFALDNSRYEMYIPATVDKLDWDPDIAVVQLQQDTGDPGGTFQLWFDQITFRSGT